MKGWTDKDEKALEEMRKRKDTLIESLRKDVNTFFFKSSVVPMPLGFLTIIEHNGQELLDVLVKYFEPSPTPPEGYRVIEAGENLPIVGVIPQTLTPAENAGLNKLRNEMLKHPSFNCAGDFKLPNWHDAPLDIPQALSEGRDELKRIKEKFASYEIHFTDIPLDRAIEAEKVLDGVIFDIDMFIKSQPDNRYIAANIAVMVRSKFHLTWVKRVTELTPQTPPCQHEYVAIAEGHVCRKCGHIKS